MSDQADRQRAALERMAKDDPGLAARLILMTMPGAASTASKSAQPVVMMAEQELPFDRYWSKN